MALPTLNVTPGSGATINTLPNAPATTASSVSVALATDQSPVPVTAASLPLPTGAMPAAGGSVALAAGTNVVGGVTVADPASGHVANVFQFHNADNVALGGTAYGLNTGGVAQLLNAAGNLDRQREAGVDGVPAQGVASGAASFAMQFKTSIASAIAAGAQTVTPAAMSGIVGGVSWSIQVGSALIVDSGASKEVVIVSAIGSSTFTAVFAKAHSTSPVLVTGFVYNQGRDASGENDGATGSGTAVAAEYAYNAGDPSGGNFDRARNLNAKGLTTETISAGGGASSTSLTLAAAAGLQPGTKVLLYKSSTFPASGSFESVNVDLSYAPGSTSVPLASAIVGGVGYDTIGYDAFSALGPQLNGFLPFGVGIEEAAIFDPASGKYYVERAATQDAMPPQNVVVMTPGLWNGATVDRATGSASRGLDVNVKPQALAYTNVGGYLPGAVSAAAISAAGTLGGWVPGDTMTLDAVGAPVTASAVFAVATTQVVGTPTIAAAGAFTGTTGNYNVVGTTGTGAKFQINCTLTNGSGITAVLGIVYGGAYTANPTTLTAEPVAYAGLTGATLSIKMGPATLTVPTPGSYAPATAAQVATVTAARTPNATSGAGSLTGVTVTPAFAGLATQVAAASASRKRLFLQNISGSNLGYSFFTTAPALGVPGTETLAPLNSIDESGDVVSNQAFYVIGSAFAAYSARTM